MGGGEKDAATKRYLKEVERVRVAKLLADPSNEWMRVMHGGGTSRSTPKRQAPQGDVDDGEGKERGRQSTGLRAEHQGGP